MSNKWGAVHAVWVAIAGFVIVLLLSIIFVDQGKSISFWIPLIVAAPNCGVTVLSRYETRRDQSALEERNTLPFLVLETVKIWENHENGNRFPWGGDPEPQHARFTMIRNDTLFPCKYRVF